MMNRHSWTHLRVEIAFCTCVASCGDVWKGNCAIAVLLGFIGCSVHWDSVKDLEQEVDGPTGEKKLLKTLCVVGTPFCTVQY